MLEVSTVDIVELGRMWPNMDWSQYEEPSPFSFHEAQPALISFYAILWIIGLVGNLWVAFVVGYLLVTRKTSRRAGDAPLTVQTYIFSLCLCDLLVLSFVPLLLLDLVYGSWKIPSSSLCKFYLLSEGFNKFGAPWLLTALSGFCYSNIQRMVQFDSRRTSGGNGGGGGCGFDSETDTDQLRKISACSTTSTTIVATGGGGYFRQRQASELSTAAHAAAVHTKRQSSAGSLAAVAMVNSIRAPDSGRKAALTVLTCAVAVVLAMCPVFIYADIHYVIVHNETQIHILALKCVFQPPQSTLTAFTVYSFLGGYLCPAFLFTYYYSAILFYVRRHRTKNNAHSSGGSSSRSHQRYCRVARTAIGLVGWTLAGWTPYWVIFLYFYFHPQTDAESAANASTTIVLSYFVHMLPYINCSGYPILYTLLNKNIRTAYARAKMASANRRRRRRFASIVTGAVADGGGNGNGGSPLGGGNGGGHTSGTSVIGKKCLATSATVRLSHDCSTCGALTPMTISVQYDDASSSCCPFENESIGGGDHHSKRVLISTPNNDQNHLQV